MVANETLSGRALRDEISERGHSGEAQLKVVCPALNSKIKHWTNEEDDARAQAAGAACRRCFADCAARASTPMATSGTTTPCRRWRTRCGGSRPTR